MKGKARNEPTITLSKGQMIHWPRAVGGYAQVDDLRRKKVRLVYRTKRGTLRFAIVAAAELMHRQAFMPGVFNVLDRGILQASRVYPLSALRDSAEVEEKRR